MDSTDALSCNAQVLSYSIAEGDGDLTRTLSSSYAICLRLFDIVLSFAAH
jgi:hypothetical protein